MGVDVEDPGRIEGGRPVAGEGDGDEVDTARRAAPALPGKTPGDGVEGDTFAPIESERRPPDRFGVDFAAGEGYAGGWTSPLTVAIATV